MEGVADKVVLVTGAGQACGRVIAEDFGARGASVVVNDIDETTGAATARAITDGGGTAHFVAADVSVDAQVATLVDEAVSTYGRLDIAVNNAGNEHPVLIADSTAEQFAQVLATNLEGARACLVHEIRAMRANGGGSILNMSSVTSNLTAAVGGGLYGSTKGGINALTRTAAVEVAKEGISINALAFIGADVDDGMFQRWCADTGIPAEQILAGIPIGRTLRPEELCAAVRYLTSDDARFVLGTTFVLDGGFTSV